MMKDYIFKKTKGSIEFFPICVLWYFHSKGQPQIPTFALHLDRKRWSINRVINNEYEEQVQEGEDFVEH